MKVVILEGGLGTRTSEESSVRPKQPMDTLRDKLYLEDLWKSGKAPWEIW
jgi:NDP-sugar pyrophosphorylase family protein